MPYNVKNIPTHYYLVIIMLIAFLLGFLCIDNGHNWSDDFALYIEQCQALLNGDTITLLEKNRFAMDNSYAHVGPYLYPTGFPLLLLPVYAIFGLNFWILKMYCWLFFVAALPLIYWIFKQENFLPKQALLATALVGFNYHFIRFADNILSDLPFFFFSCWSVFLIQKQVYKNVFGAIFLGLILFFTYSIRDIGIMLLPCLFLYQFQSAKKEKNGLDIKFLLPYFVFILIWFAINYSLPGRADKNFELFANTSISTVINNLYFYGLLVGNYFVIFRGIPIWMQHGISCFFIAIILVGIYKNRPIHLPILAYVGLTLGLYFLWVSFQGMRFIFPVIPFLIFYLIWGFKTLFQQEKILNAALYLLLASTIFQGVFTSYFYYKTDTNEAYTADLQKIYAYIQKELPPDAVIVFHKPRALRLFTGRNAVQKDIEEADYQVVKTKDGLENILVGTESYSLIEN